MRTFSFPLLVAVILAMSSQLVAQETQTPPAEPVPLPAREWTLDGSILASNLDSDTPLMLPCIGESLLVYGDKLYVACGREGLVIVNAQPGARATIDAHVQHSDGAVTGVFELDGQLWLKLQRTEARPLAGSEPMLLGADTVVKNPQLPVKKVAEQAEKPAEPKTPTAVANVLETVEDTVIIDKGTEAGFAKGQHIELFVERSRSLGGNETANEEDRVAVGKILAISEGRASVELGINEEVPAGAQARYTELALTSSSMSPPRAEGLWEVSFMFRPFLALGTLGFGSVSEVEAAYRFDGPLVIRALFQPAALGIADDGDVLALAANVVAAYDTRLFEVGLGLGWSAVNDTPGVGFSSSDSTGGAPKTEGSGFESVENALSIMQAVRLGARDGLTLLANNNFVLFKDKFLYGGTNATIQIPTTAASWMLLRGGGGLAGYWYGEVALRVLFSGNGERDSLFMTVSLGAAGLFGEKEVVDGDYTYQDSIGYGGPAAGFGLEWRL